MAYFINYCRQIVDLDKDQDLVELSYSKYIEGFGYEKFTDYFKTKREVKEEDQICEILQRAWRNQK